VTQRSLAYIQSFIHSFIHSLTHSFISFFRPSDFVVRVVSAFKSI